MKLAIIGSGNVGRSVGAAAVRAGHDVVLTAADPANAAAAAEEIHAAAPGAHVVKAFNTIFAALHAHPAEGDTPLDAFGAGDDEAAKDRVAELARSIGYRWIDAGGLGMARALEQMAFLNITLNARNGWPWQSAWKLVGPAG